jgi:hypothetical protein
MVNYKNIIINWINDAINKKSINIFEYVFTQMKQYHDSKSNIITIHSNKNTSTKIKGDLFEIFSVLYFESLEYNVWLIKDMPENILTFLGLTKRDMGIDIVIEKNGEFSAVQCKYKTKYPATYKCKKYNNLCWKQLSTFYGLVARSGPWKNHIIITTGDKVILPGTKTDMDYIITYSDLLNIDNVTWHQIVFLHIDCTNKIKTIDLVKTEIPNININKNKPTINELRNLRLLYYKKNE